MNANSSTALSEDRLLLLTSCCDEMPLFMKTNKRSNPPSLPFYGICLSNILFAGHRISCHRCGNIRKRTSQCERCPHVYCRRCTIKVAACLPSFPFLPSFSDLLLFIHRRSSSTERECLRMDVQCASSSAAAALRSVSPPPQYLPP